MRPVRNRRLLAAWPALSVLAVLVALAGCAGGPPGADARAPAPGREGRPDRDGPPVNPPPDLAAVPDPEPQLEPIRPGGPNKPYEIAGETYVPLVQDLPYAQRGLASWYGRKFHGARTASGERYDMYAMTAAHPTLPIPSYARVRNPANGREVVVRINDRGPFHSSRIIDLSYTAALKLDLLRGVAVVELRHITGDEIRAAAAGRAGPVGAAVAVGPVATPRAAPPAPVAESSPGAPGGTAAGAAAFDVDAGNPSLPATTPAYPPDASPSPAPGVWVQFGAFRAREGALELQRRLEAEQDWLAPLLAVFHDAPFFRLQAGPFADRVDARQAAERVRRGSKLPALIVERP